MSAKDRARETLNTRCVDCDLQPYAGGLRCWSCFKKRIDLRQSANDHVFPVAPSQSAYRRGCRCNNCRSAHTRHQREQRARNGVGR